MFWTFGIFRRKVSLLKRNCFFNIFFGPWENLFRTYGEFFMQVRHTCTLLTEENFFGEKISFWNCFNNCVEWSVLGKKTFSKRTHNFTFFVRSWAKQFRAFGKKTWSRVVKGAFYWASEYFSAESFFEERSLLQHSLTSS